MNLRDIKDRTPNVHTIAMLEKALEQAKTGELRAVLLVKEFDDSSVNHHWSIDRRTSRRMLLAEVAMAQLDLAVNISIEDGDTVLAMALQDG